MRCTDLGYLVPFTDSMNGCHNVCLETTHAEAIDRKFGFWPPSVRMQYSAQLTVMQLDRDRQ